MLIQHKIFIVIVTFFLSVLSLRGYADTELWTQDFSTDAKGLSQLPQSVNVGSGVLNLSTSESHVIYIEHVYAFEAGVQIQAQATFLNESELGNDFFHFGITNNALDRSHGLVFHGGQVYAKRVNNSGLVWVSLGSYQSNTPYQLELVTDQNNGTTVRVYELGADPSTGFQNQMQDVDWREVYALIELSRVDSGAVANIVVDNISEKVTASLPDGDIVLWQQNFSTNADGLTDLGAYFSVNNGKLTIDGPADATDLPPIYGDRLYPPEANVTFKSQLTPNIFANGAYLSSGITDQQAGNAHFATLLNDQWIAAIINDGQYSDTVLGSAQLNTNYQIEIDSTPTESRLFIYEQGQSRDQALQHTFTKNNWLGIQLYLGFYVGSDNSPVQATIDNLVEVVKSDTVQAPNLSIDTPLAGSYSNIATPTINLSYSSQTDIDTNSIQLTENGNMLAANCNSNQLSAECVPNTAFVDGEVNLSSTVADILGNVSEPAETTFIVDTVAPVVTIDAPISGGVTNQPGQVLAGTLSESVETLTLTQFNDLTQNSSLQSLPVGSNTNFNQAITLDEGVNTLTVTGIDFAGNLGSASSVVSLDTQIPALPDASSIEVSEPNNDTVDITGGANSAEPNSQVTITNTRTGQVVIAVVGASGAFVAQIQAEVGDTLQLSVSDVAGNNSGEISLSVEADLPPDPSAIAPSLDPTQSVPFVETVSFLYSGNNPIQTGVQSGTIDSAFAAVIRGTVRDRDNNPLSGVSVSILNRPEFGQTLTRADGMFDLAVNGGKVLTIQYERDGYLPVQRKITMPWQDYSIADDIVMVVLDTQVTTIDLNSALDFQVARGSMQTDTDGARQATLLFPQNTTAVMTLSDGSTQPLSSLNVRATEYTVGDNGPTAMPASLPANSAYTYAVELSVDEALVAGANRVDFNQAVPFYVDNFLNFPTGETVPSGYYDRELAQWIASDNGRIIEILAINNGQAEIDTTGDGNAATQSELDELNMNTAELQQLANLYGVGQSLWRVPISHFTPWDLNWPFAPPSDAERPTDEEATTPENSADNSDEDCEQGGCIIRAQSQVLGETIPIAGTPYSLHYSSDRMPGRVAKNTINIPVSGSQTPPSLLRMRVKITVAGQTVTELLSPFSDYNYTFEWDGLDAYGREMYGSATAKVEVGFIYPCLYLAAPSSNGGGGIRSFGRDSLTPDGVIGTRDNCDSFIFSRDWKVTIESPFTPPANLVGGWSLNTHHYWSANGARLYLGDGSYRTLETVIDTISGNGEIFETGDGGFATDAGITANNVLLDDENNLYISGGSSIRRVSRDGIISTLVNTSGVSCCFAGMDFDEAGNIYVADTSGYIRRIDINGVMTTLAGDGTLGFAGDNGLATNARFRVPRDVAVDNNGNIYIADSGNERVRRISPDGIITTVAGTGLRGFSGNGGSAAQAQLHTPMGVEVDVEGNLYIADAGNNLVRKMDTSGIITTAVGDGFNRFSGDGGLATEASLRSPRDVSFDRFGNMYIADIFNHRVRRVGSDGIITTVAGIGNLAGSTGGSFSGDGGPPLKSHLHNPSSIAVDPNGDIYIADSVNLRVRRVFGLFNQPFSDTDIRVASGDGTELYQFNNGGRHIRTLDTLTSVVTQTFGRDSEGRLISITDQYNNATYIERDANGQISAIVAPDGQRTAFTYDGNGYLASVNNPENEQYQMTYTPLGLMTEFRDRRDQPNTFQYNALGMLIQDTNAGGGGWTINRTSTDNASHDVNMTTGEGRVLTFSSEQLSNGDRQLTNTFADGSVQSQLLRENGEQVVTQANGTSISVEAGPDPRFSMQAPLAKRASVSTPSGLTSITTTQRAATLQDISDLLSLQTQTDTVDVNGRISTSQYDVTARTFTNTSAQGRISTRELNTQGQIINTQVNGLAGLNFNYDARGRVTQIAQGVGAQQRSTSLNYYNSGGQAGYLQSVTDAENRTVNFEYDAVGRVTRQVLPDNRAIQYSYDTNGNLISLTPPGQPAHIFNYNAFDLEGNYTPPAVSGINNPATVYDYNLDKELELITRPDGQTLDFQYDADSGQLENLVMSDNRNYAYSYIPNTGQLNTVTSPDAVTLDYDYDGFLLTGVDWSGAISGSLDIAYNNNFLVTQRCVNTSSCISFNYDNDNLLTGVGDLLLTRDLQRGGLITAISLGDTSTDYTYNTFGEMESVGNTYQSTDLYDVSYQRDNLGRITQKTEVIQGTSVTEIYGYDLAGRLTSVNRNGTITNYNYDSNGNRLNRTQGTQIEAGSYDAQDRLLTYDNCAYSYTDNGELTSKICAGQTSNYSYDLLGNLLSVTLPNSDVVEYIIDGQNRRVGRRVNGTQAHAWLYGDQLNPIAELNPDGSIRSRFIYADKINVPTYIVRDGIAYRIISDHLGSPRLVVNSSTGQVIQRMDYDEFGRVLSDTNPGFQPFGFAGGMYDSQTGLVRFGARDYDSQIGRWSSKDPIKFHGGINLYAYASNDSINRIDPTGLADINMIPAGESGRQGGGNITGPDGSFSMAGHGSNGEAHRGGNNTPVTTLRPSSAASLILNHPNFNPGQDIYLFICEAGKGKNSFAEQLKKIMGDKAGTVRAPTDVINVAPNGMWEHDTTTGSMRAFE